MDESDPQTHPGAQQWKGSQIDERAWGAEVGVSGDLGYERGGDETGGCHKKADAEGKRGADTDGGIPHAGA